MRSLSRAMRKISREQKGYWYWYQSFTWRETILTISLNSLNYRIPCYGILQNHENSASWVQHYASLSRTCSRNTHVILLVDSRSLLVAAIWLPRFRKFPWKNSDICVWLLILCLNNAFVPNAVTKAFWLASWPAHRKQASRMNEWN